MTTEYGWLIEKETPEGKPVWAFFSEHGVHWTDDASLACRFCRREDAEQMAYGEDVTAVTEHGFD